MRPRHRRRYFFPTRAARRAAKLLGSETADTWSVSAQAAAFATSDQVMRVFNGPKPSRHVRVFRSFMFGGKQ